MVCWTFASFLAIFFAVVHAERAHQTITSPPPIDTAVFMSVDNIFRETDEAQPSIQALLSEVNAVWSKKGDLPAIESWYSKMDATYSFNLESFANAKTALQQPPQITDLPASLKQAYEAFASSFVDAEQSIAKSVLAHTFSSGASPTSAIVVTTMFASSLAPTFTSGMSTSTVSANASVSLQAPSGTMSVVPYSGNAAAAFAKPTGFGGVVGMAIGIGAVGAAALAL